MEIRRARTTDTARICEIINFFADKDLMLPRSPLSVCENIRDFYVAVVDGQIAGCSALHFSWHDMAEVRSLAVDERFSKMGLGRALVEANISDAREHDLALVYTFTYVKDFFERFGFHVVAHDSLPRKVWVDCANCIKFNCCDEIAMVLQLRERDPAGYPFPVSAKSLKGGA